MRHSLHPFAIVTFLSILGWLGNVEAQTVATDPVGAITLTLKGGSDTHVSLPFHRPVALETQAQSISGNVTAATITVSASANLTASQFVYVAGSQTNTYYLQFTSGSRNGMYYTVTTNDGSTITVDPNGDAGLVANGFFIHLSIKFFIVYVLRPCFALEVNGGIDKKNIHLL